MSKSKLFKGVFWYKRGELLPFFIPCDESGTVLEVTEYPLESKDGTNYNHQKLWARLPRSVTEGNAFNFYPRGRVEIGKGRATVFLHPSLFTEEIEREIGHMFGLIAENRVKLVRFVPDGSTHYHAEVKSFS